MARSTGHMQHWHAGYYDEQKHGAAWDRIKEAMHRDWEQTKADFSKTKGQELDQDVDDTVKQAIGKEPIPPEGVPNPDDDFSKNEVPIEYGYVARMQYGDRYSDWNDDLERQLDSEWDANKTGRQFKEVKPYIRRGYEYRK
jgi:hypothetical protein